MLLDPGSFVSTEGHTDPNTKQNLHTYQSLHVVNNESKAMTNTRNTWIRDKRLKEQCWQVAIQKQKLA